MVTFLMVLFVVLCIMLSVIILLQQGKGDMGLGSMAGAQTLFGGSGGQDFFEKVTWLMGALFIVGALGLTILKTKENEASRAKPYASLGKTQQANLPQGLPQKEKPKKG